jgi:uncharacterized repeat protein (TIGR03837 family)
MLWDLFCRVIDNFGDVGVCWRLACDLAQRGQRVRLWLDDVSALAWMAPLGHAAVQVIPWTPAPPAVRPGDRVVEAFGCDPPADFVARMAGADRPPVWINLEYLSAEGFVERCHGLPSPQAAGPGAGLVKWFFYPGFTPRTGGLVREDDLEPRQRAFDSAAWLGLHGVQRGDGERVVSLFCYANAALGALLDALARQPTVLLATAGPALEQVSQHLGPSLVRRALRAVAMPRLTQAEYDHLLWASDVNFVRGEDSFVRAQFAGKPMVWQVYPQDDGAHRAKLKAFVNLYLGGAAPELARQIDTLWEAWNGTAAGPGGDLRLPAAREWSRHALAWRAELMRQEPLGARLIRFAGEKG